MTSGIRVTEQLRKHEPKQAIASALNKDANIAMWSVAAAMVAAGAYWLAFRQLSLGGPDSWALFGDYFGGLINPMVGIVTVLLVVRTLHTTRQEAHDTRLQLREQISLSERQLVLSEMQKRLEGIYTEWRRSGEDEAQDVVALVDGVGPAAIPGHHKVAAILEDKRFVARARELADSEWGTRHYRAAWADSYSKYAHLLDEYADYCDEYESEAKNSIIADYYRRRVLTPATALGAMRVLSDSSLSRLRPSSLRS